MGNRRVAELIQARRLTPQGRIIGIQPKLVVGAADDQYEQEADRVARQVMTMPDAGPANSMQRAALPEETEKTAEEDKDKLLHTQPLGASITPLEPPRMEEKEPEDKEMPLQAKSSGMGEGSMQRQTAPEEEEAEPIQASAAGSWAESFEAGGDVESRLNRSKGGGSPLPDSVRAFMEPRFGMDFGQVRAHTGSEAIQMNRDVGARAFTHGADIYYGAGHSPANLELTAHELTHVVQQTGGAPLQMKRVAKTTLANPNLSMQRTCPACGADKKQKDILGANISFASSSNTAELPIQRDKIGHGTLTWGDFQGEVPKTTKYAAEISSSFEDPDFDASMPNNAAADTGQPCKAKGKDVTKFTVDITIDPAQIEVKSFMDQEKSWRKHWTTDAPARREKCEKEWSPVCEKNFDKQFSKIKKAVSKEKSRCQKELDEKKMKKNAKKQCKPLEDECKAAFKQGDSSYAVNFDGVEITASDMKECATVLSSHCIAATMKERKFSVSVDGESATAASEAECKTVFAPELERLLKDQVTWEATAGDDSATVNNRGNCRKTLVDKCAADFLQVGSETLLNHEQVHFDLTDAMAQKAQNDLRSLVDAFPTEVDACGQKAAEAKAKKVLASELKKMKKNYAANKKLLKKKQAQYDKETKHGIVEKKQAAWEEKISEGF